MSFNGKEGGAITLARGAALTKAHRAAAGSTEKGHFFGRNVLEEILAQAGCMGIRMYYGMDPDSGKRELILVGADSDENDILDMIVDLSTSCPTVCSTQNPLNS